MRRGPVEVDERATVVVLERYLLLDGTLGSLTGAASVGFRWPWAVQELSPWSDLLALPC